MRLQTLLVLLLALLVGTAIFATATDAGFGRGGGNDSDIGKEGGDTDSDGGDPDGVGLDGPSNPFAPAMPNANFRENSAAASNDLGAVFRTALSVANALDHLVW